MGLWMLMLTVVSGGQNEEPRADDEGCQEFGHVFEGARGRVDFGHDVWGWNNGANYRVLSIFVVSLASAGWIWFRIFSLLGTSRQFFYNRLCLVFPFPLFAYVCCVFFSPFALSINSRKPARFESLSSHSHTHNSTWAHTTHTHAQLLGPLDYFLFLFSGGCVRQS